MSDDRVKSYFQVIQRQLAILRQQAASQAETVEAADGIIQNVNPAIAQ